MVNLNFIWLGSDLPEDVSKNISSWEKNPEYEVNIINDYEAPEWVGDISLEGRPWAQVADVVRLAPFVESQGWYLDVDCQPGRISLSNLDRTTLFRTEPNSLANGIFFWNGDFEFMECWREQICLGLNSNQSVAIATGPGALTRAVYVHALRYGVRQTRKTVSLGKYKYFVHWPAQFHKVTKWIPARFRFGLFATHFANGSWDSEKLESKKTLEFLSKAVLWRLRNSSVGLVLESMRQALGSGVPLREKICLFVLGLVSNSSNIHPSNIRSINSLSAEVSGSEGLKDAVQDLSKIFIISTNRECSSDLKSAGWKQRRLAPGVRAWVRPPLSKILG